MAMDGRTGVLSLPAKASPQRQTRGPKAPRLYLALPARARLYSEPEDGLMSRSPGRVTENATTTARKEI